MAFGDYNTALELRDIIKQMVAAEIDRQRPQYRYGTVTSIDRTLRKATVLFSSDVTPVPVNMGAVQPSAEGQTVRVDGMLGDRFISDVLGPIYLDSPTVDDATSTGQVTASSMRSEQGRVWFSTAGGNHDLISYDDATNRYSLLADAANFTDPANADLVARHLYTPEGASLTAIENAKMLISGGGSFVTTSTTFGWTQRFICIGMGLGAQWGTNGYFDISMPADGTIITGINGASNVAVGGGVITFPSWGVLWYELPIGSGSATVNGNFYMSNYNTTGFSIPPHWIPVAQRQTDSMSAGWKVCTGSEVDYWHAPSLTNGWVNYSSPPGYSTAGYRKDNGIVRLKGLIKSGTIAIDSTGVAFTLPAGFKPGVGGNSDSNLGVGINDGISNGTQGRVDLGADGTVKCYAGNNGYVSLENIQFVAQG